MVLETLHGYEAGYWLSSMSNPLPLIKQTLRHHSWMYYCKNCLYTMNCKSHTLQLKCYWKYCWEIKVDVLADLWALNFADYYLVFLWVKFHTPVPWTNKAMYYFTGFTTLRERPVCPSKFSQKKKPKNWYIKSVWVSRHLLGTCFHRLIEVKHSHNSPSQELADKMFWRCGIPIYSCQSQTLYWHQHTESACAVIRWVEH